MKQLKGDYNKLKEGMKFKNYKELCEFIGWKVTRGNGKNTQLKELERYFKYQVKPNNSIHILEQIKKLPTIVYKERTKEDINNKTKYQYEKLQEGMIFNTYKELCDFLGWNYKTSKATRLKELKSFCKYNEDNNIYEIMEVFEMRKIVIDETKNNDVEKLSIANNIILQLLLHYLSKDEEEIEQYVVSKSKLIELVGLVNCNYNTCKGRIKKASDYFGVNYQISQEFFGLNNQSFLNKIEQAMKMLRNYRVIQWQMSTMIVYNDIENIEYEYKTEYNDYIEEYENVLYTENKIKKKCKIATTKERCLINKQEKLTLEELGLSSMQQVFSTGKVEQYFNKLRSNIANKTSIKGYEYSYQCYDIVYNFIGLKNHLATFMNTYIEDNDINKMVINDLIKENRYIVNVYNGITVDKLTDNRQTKAHKDNDNNTLSKTYEYRIKEYYKEQTNILKDNTLNINAEDYREEIFNVYKKKNKLTQEDLINNKLFVKNKIQELKDDKYKNDEVNKLECFGLIDLDELL